MASPTPRASRSAATGYGSPTSMPQALTPTPQASAGRSPCSTPAPAGGSRRFLVVVSASTARPDRRRRLPYLGRQHLHRPPRGLDPPTPRQRRAAQPDGLPPPPVPYPAK